MRRWPLLQAKDGSLLQVVHCVACLPSGSASGGPGCEGERKSVWDGRDCELCQTTVCTLVVAQHAHTLQQSRTCPAAKKPKMDWQRLQAPHVLQYTE